MADLMKVAHEAKELLEAEGVYCELAVSDRRSCGGQIVFSCVLGWDYFKKKGWAKRRRVIDAVSKDIKAKHGDGFSVSACADCSSDVDRV